jgi:hypothetical protein
MKKLGILSATALLLLSMTSCGSGEGETTTDPAATAANAGEVTTTPATNPMDNPEDAGPDLPVTTAAFTEENHDFGKIKEGEKVVYEYKFKNTGSNPLKISNVKPSCGCTTPDWTKEEIAPGGQGFVKVEFDSKGKAGFQKKSVTVTMNTEPKTKILNFQTEVEGDGSTPATGGH